MTIDTGILISSSCSLIILTTLAALGSVTTFLAAQLEVNGLSTGARNRGLSAIVGIESLFRYDAVNLCGIKLISS